MSKVHLTRLDQHQISSRLQQSIKLQNRKIDKLLPNDMNTDSEKFMALERYTIKAVHNNVRLKKKDIKQLSEKSVDEINIETSNIKVLVPLSLAKEFTKYGSREDYKKRHSEIFSEGSDRAYYSFTSLEPSSTEEKVAKILIEKGYSLKDYKCGYATDGKRDYKIGGLIKDNEELLRLFNEDITRNDCLLVVSRHPYDIARMSTGRSWKSCMDHDGGINHHRIESQIDAGDIVAYITNSYDTNINKPLSRCMLRANNNIWFNGTDFKADIPYGIDKRSSTNVFKALAEETSYGNPGVYHRDFGAYSEYYTEDFFKVGAIKIPTENISEVGDTAFGIAKDLASGALTTGFSLALVTLGTYGALIARPGLARTEHTVVNDVLLNTAETAEIILEEFPEFKSNFDIIVEQEFGNERL